MPPCDQPQVLQSSDTMALSCRRAAALYNRRPVGISPRSRLFTTSVIAYQAEPARDATQAPHFPFSRPKEAIPPKGSLRLTLAAHSHECTCSHLSRHLAYLLYDETIRSDSDRNCSSISNKEGFYSHHTHTHSRATAAPYTAEHCLLTLQSMASC